MAGNSKRKSKKDFIVRIVLVWIIIVIKEFVIDFH